ncbi:hypothetical protein [Hansschlegelia zhihuaiae]|uniref:Uncharacterized protein n=1 Tax=Hansschlegelia zhihuaiae TaxID=405005 RepID=A0A4Q0MK96_9HYPH|nr:hypothetical protein [Hansschlegelia zhihuaiae]RXF73915.1 hypothetical protein EK403_08065 [Hansschlegelia zhihuaiae]
MREANVREFVGEVRTHLTTILGFHQMLDDPELRLSPERRAEYGAIVATSGALLSDYLEREAPLLLASEAA